MPTWFGSLEDLAMSKPAQRLMEHTVAEFLQRHQKEVELGAVLPPLT
jgi:hypothetical protein